MAIRSRFRWLIIVLFALIAIALSNSIWLPWIGNYLVQAVPPSKADIIVVLAGDGWGRRILRGGDLAREGYAPQVLVSGPDGAYDNFESDLAISFAERKGYPRSLFIAFPHHARSTNEEAALIVPALRARGVKHFILVTSDTHTRRAGRNFRRIAKDMQVTVVAAESKEFAPETWWRVREGRKAVLYEWMKTVADWFGL